IAALRDDPATTFLSKWESHSLRELIHSAYGLLGLTDVQKPKIFIVHGHDEATKLALKNFLQNKLHFPEPIILHEQPSVGRTVIEKFEDYAFEASVVCVLLTPDDVGAAASDSDDLK